MSEQQNTQQPVARISLHRVDGVPRATLLQTLGGAAVLPIGEIDVYAAPVVAANEQQNTQHPVAVTTAVPADAENYLRQKYGAARAHPEWRALEAAFYAGMKLQADRNAAPPVPRDVLMAFGEAVRDAWLEYEDGQRFTVDLAAIADRYASQVQSEPQLISYAPDMATCTLRIGDEQYLFDRHTTQSEPVNQQTLAALKDCVEDSRQVLAQDEQIYSESYRPHRLEYQRRVVANAEAAIAAAEAAQPVVYPIERVLTDADHLAHCVDAILLALNKYHGAKARAEVEETAANVLELEHCEAAVSECWRAAHTATYEYRKRAQRYRDSAATQQPASAQPVAVPEGGE